MYWMLAAQVSTGLFCKLARLCAASLKLTYAIAPVRHTTAWAAACCCFVKDGSSQRCCSKRIAAGHAKGIQSQPGLYTELALRPPQASKNIPNLSQNDCLSGGYPNRVLVSTAKVGISAPDAWTSVSIGFPGIHRCFWFFCPETNYSYGACHQN